MGAPKPQKSDEVFLCISYTLQNTNGQEVELIRWLAGDRSVGQSYQLLVEAKFTAGTCSSMQMRMNVGCDPIYMHMQMLMKCLCSAL